jgi:hypothetical protein
MPPLASVLRVERGEDILPRRADDPVSRERIERALRFVAAIVAEPGGEVYLPIFERLERELTDIDAKADALARARTIAAFNSRSSPSTRRGA